MTLTALLPIPGAPKILFSYTFEEREDGGTTSIPVAKPKSKDLPFYERARPTIEANFTAGFDILRTMVAERPAASRNENEPPLPCLSNALRPSRSTRASESGYAVGTRIHAASCVTRLRPADFDSARRPGDKARRNPIPPATGRGRWRPYRNGGGRAVDGERPALGGPAGALGDPRRLGSVDVRHHDDEFLPAESAEEVAAADDLLQLSSEALEHEIADVMTVGVVHAREMVDVENHYCQGRGAPARGFDHRGRRRSRARRLLRPVSGS